MAANAPDQQQASSSSADTIQLKVKVPPGHLSNTSATGSSSFDLGRLSITTTIGALRLQIQQLVPTHPPPERQRLLYGGRALVDNDQTVQDALNTKRDPQQGEYVIHLLVKGEGLSGHPPTPVTRVSQDGNRRTGSAPPHPPTGSQAHDSFSQNLEQQEQTQGQPPPANPWHFPPAQMTATQAPPQQTPMGQIPMHQLQRQQLAHQAMLQQHAQQQQMIMQQRLMQGGQMAVPMQSQINAPQLPHLPVGMNPPPNMPMPMQGHVHWHQLRPMQQQAQQSGNGNNATSEAVNGDGTPAQPSVASNGEAQQNGQPHPQNQFQPQNGPGNPWQGTYRVETRGPDGRIHVNQHNFNMNPNQLQQGMPPFPPFPAMHPAGPHMQMPPPGMQLLAQNIPHQPPRGEFPGRTSALDRARENISDMRRMLDELRNSTQPNSGLGGVEQLQQRIDEVEVRARAVEEYIDPFHLGVGPNRNTNARSEAWSTTAVAGSRSASLPPSRRTRSRRPANESPEQPTTTSNEVRAYLLSGPRGPQALLFSPHFGAYTGTLQNNLRPTPSRTETEHEQEELQRAENIVRQRQAQPDPVAQAAAAHFANGAAAHQAANAQAVAAGRDPGVQDPLAPIQPLLAHFWLLLRILIFAYFLLGANLGYTRPLLLVGIGMLFWAVRTGMLGDGRAIRRWWDGVVGVPQQQERRGEGQPAQGPNQAQNQNNGAGDVAPAHQDAGQPQQQQRMPTPEQVAQRLLNEDDARRQERGNWLREQIRPVERAVALFLASLWPGIGEAHVRAQEQEQRRLQEEEVAARRRAEEASSAAQEAEGERKLKTGENVEESSSMEKMESGEGGKVQTGEGGKVEVADAGPGEGSA